MPPVGFEPEISASERMQTSDRPSTGLAELLHPRIACQSYIPPPHLGHLRAWKAWVVVMVTIPWDRQQRVMIRLLAAARHISVLQNRPNRLWGQKQLPIQ
jgi:hypothetical protein